MATENFVHLHVHSDFSLLDGASKINDVVSRAAELGMPALAITDHGVMHGVIDFYEACGEKGINPIIGCEVYVAPRTRFDRDARLDSQKETCHLLLLAENEAGYKNLIKIVSKSHTEGFYYKPRTDHELLTEHAEGIICASACLGGEIPQLIIEDHYEQSRRLAEKYRDIFGRDNFFLELQQHGFDGEQKVNEALVKLSDDLTIPLICTNDSHYTRKEDAHAQQVLLCIGTGKTLDDPDRMQYGDQFYLKTAEEMAQTFGHIPASLHNTVEIANRCKVKLSLGNTHFPNFEVPEGHTLETYLDFLCSERFPQRFPGRDPAARQRMEYELSVIKDKGYAGYFLVVQDFVNHAKQQGILVGPGRGSAAGCMVAYILGITNINPLQYGLLFERFLNPERASNPDIDLDFQHNRRDEVLQYVIGKYGQDHVAQIATFGTLKTRASIRDAGRVMGMDLATVDRIAKMVPESNRKITVDTALESDPALQELYEKDTQIRELLDTVRRIEGTTRNGSVHPCGVVISREPLDEVVPLQRNKDGSGVVTQFEGSGVEKVGLVKMDFLGLDNTTIISEALRLIKEHRGIEVDIDAIPYDDRKTYEMLSRGDTVGVFQLESSGMRTVLRSLRPDCFDHLVPLVALYRPGPMEEIPKYVDGRHGRVQVAYAHPKLEPVLKETFGVLLYQEQVMRTATDLAGFTLPQAEVLMKAMSKKQHSKMLEMKSTFIEGCTRNAVPKKTALAIFERMESFAQYAFNKSHSAAYAVVAYQTAYLKANYTQEFMAARLTAIMDDKKKLAAGIEDCRKMGVNVLQPDINASRLGFTVDGDSVRFGLEGIKNVGQAPVEAILTARDEGGAFADLFNLCERVSQKLLGRSVIECLIKSGAFDSLHPVRAQAMAALESALEFGAQSQRDRSTGQVSLFGDVLPDASGGGVRPGIPPVPEVGKDQRLTWEKELLGVYLSDHPLFSMREVIEKKATHTIEQLQDLKPEARVIVGGFIASARRFVDRNNRPMLFVTLEDLTGEVDVVVLSTVYEKCGRDIEDDAIVLVHGKTDFGRGGSRRRNGNGRKEGNGGEEAEATEVVKVIAEKIVRVDPPRQMAAGDPSHASLAQVSIPLQEEELEVLGEKAVPPLSTIRTVHLGMSSQLANPNTLDSLKALLQQHPGPHDVRLHLDDGHKVTELSLGPLRVDFTIPFQKSVQRILGEAAVWVD